MHADVEQQGPFRGRTPVRMGESPQGGPRFQVSLVLDVAGAGQQLVCLARMSSHHRWEPGVWMSPEQGEAVKR